MCFIHGHGVLHRHFNRTYRNHLNGGSVWGGLAAEAFPSAVLRPTARVFRDAFAADCFQEVLHGGLRGVMPAAEAQQIHGFALSVLHLA